MTRARSSTTPNEMVSQAQVVDRTVPVRTASSSVVSRQSHGHRRHRSNQSHHGGSIRQPQNDFPIFTHTGDAEIVIRAGDQEKRYLLHRLILTQCSGFFAASTSEEWLPQPQVQGPPAKPNSSALSRVSEDDTLSTGSTLAQSDLGGLSRPFEKRRWRFELDWDHRAEDEEPILIQKVGDSDELLCWMNVDTDTTQSPSFSPAFARDAARPPPSATKPSGSQAGFFRSMANLTGMQSTTRLPDETAEPVLDPLIRDYDNLFRLFYNHAPVLNTVNIATAYSECKSLLGLADMYDALPVTGPRVDHHLLGFGTRLFKQIAKYPPSYLKLGYMARSRVMFSEALVHVVGQWPAGLAHLRNGSYPSLPDSVLDIIEDKVEDLEDMKSRVDSKLFRLTLTTSRGERVNPTNAYLDWLAVSLFRQWLVDSTTPPPAPILKNNPSNPQSHHHHHHRHDSSSTYSPAYVYRLIGSSSTQAYLPHDDLKRFLKVHPTQSSESLYTREVLKRFERKMDEIKRLAREIVKPLMRNFLELDLKRTPATEPGRTPAGTAVGSGTHAGDLPYLTCTKVEDVDIPWT